MLIKTRFVIFLLMLILVTGLTSACDEIQASEKYALKGTSTKTPFHSKSTFTPTQEPPPTFTPSETPTDTLTPTSSPSITEIPALSESKITSSPQPFTETPKANTFVPQETSSVKVSITTNCRTGPGISYAKLSPLQAGRVATLIGRDQTSSYWVIKDPGNTGRNCWLWGYYATTTGNTKDLKVYYAPGQTATPSKTPAPTVYKTPAPTKTPQPTRTPKTPLPTNTPNLTPATFTNTPLPPTITPTPSDTPIPSNTPLPSNTPESMYCSYTSPSPADEQQIFNMINAERRKNGLNELTIKYLLVTAAREHGQDMTCHGTYSHTSTDGTKAWERIGLVIANNKNWCYSNCCCGEIFMGGGSPESAFNWWMTHEPVYQDGLNIHAWTILGKYYTRMGVGVVDYYNPNTGVTRKFYVVDFSTK